MSIQSQINRIAGNISDALAAITAKGVTVPTGSDSDDLATLIAQITTGDPSWSVSQSLTHIDSSFSANKVTKGAPLYIELEPDSGYVISSITVTMGGVDITDQVFRPGLGAKAITENGTYAAAADNLGGYERVAVQVPQASAALDEKTITQNGTYNASDDNLDGYSKVTVNVQGGTPTGTKQISVTQNGTTIENVAGYASAQITANVPNSYSAGDEGKVVSNGALVTQGSDTCSQNGTVDTTLISSLLVSVAGGSSVKTGTVTPSSASTSISFDAGLTSITGILVMPINTPLTGSRTQAAMICLPSGSFYKAISIHTNSGGTGWVSPSVYTTDRFSLSGTTVTVNGAYSFRPSVGYVWYAW